MVLKKNIVTFAAMGLETDRMILDRLRLSDREAMKVLYVRYAPQIKLFLTRISNDISLEDAEDMCHDIFISLWNHRSTIPEMENFSPYLFTMAKNALLKKIRSKKIHLKFVEVTKPSEEAFDPSERYDKKEQLNNVCKKMQTTLSNQEKAIFEMSRVEEKTYSEIADNLSISIKTVQYHISRILAKLRR